MDSKTKAEGFCHKNPNQKSSSSGNTSREMFSDSNQSDYLNESSKGENTSIAT